MYVRVFAYLAPLLLLFGCFGLPSQSAVALLAPMTEPGHCDQCDSVSPLPRGMDHFDHFGAAEALPLPHGPVFDLIIGFDTATDTHQ